MNYELRDMRHKSVAVGVPLLWRGAAERRGGPDRRKTRARRVRALAQLSVVAAVALFAASCIEKELPLPDVTGEILAFEVDGQSGGAVINTAQRTVDVVLGEAVDKTEVRVSRLDLTEGGTCDIAEGDVIDLSAPRKVTVKTVSGYEWTISATQTIEYRFEIEGVIVLTDDEGNPAGEKPVKQVGRAHFEMHSRKAFAFLPVGSDLTRVTVTALKLCPDVAGATLTPAIEPGQTVNFRTGSAGGYAVEVRYRDVTETWRLYVSENNTLIETIDSFAYSVDLSAYGHGEGECGFEYRLAAGYDPGADPATQVWTRVTAETVGGDGDFHATATGLAPSTEYLVRAFSGESVGDVEEFSTTGIKELPGGGFNEWHRAVDDRKANDISLRAVDAWNPWPQGGVWEENRWWDTGNKGVAFVDKTGGGNSLPTEIGEGCPANPAEGRAAKLQTKWAMVKVAGGNIYFGEFGSMVPGKLDATCHLGHNWSDSKPTKLKGWYKYFPQTIADEDIETDHYKQHPLYLKDPIKYGRDHWVNSPDTLHVCVALWADPQGREMPFTVNTDTTPGQFLDFSRDKPGVIAYGAFVSARTQAEWAEFEVPLDYLKQGPLPPNTQLYLLITSSKNCNYFLAATGRKTAERVGSLMYVDEVELLYER